MLSELMRSRQKVLLFATMGAGGALLAAILGELWLVLTRRPPTVKPEPLAVCLLLDCSGSMFAPSQEKLGTKLEEMKAAATRFVGRHQDGDDEFAVVGFDHQVYEVAPRSKKHDSFQAAINSIRGGGGTDMGAGLRGAASQLQGTAFPGNILLFTDGMPTSSRRGHGSPAQDTLQAAQECHSQNAKIIAIATGDADVHFLGQLTGDPSLVFSASAGEFERAFQKAEKVVFGRQLVDTSLTAEGLGYAIFRIATWTAILAAGIALALIAGQNRYLRRPLLIRQQAIAGGLGGLAAGLAAGGLGQVIFAGATTASTPVVVLGRLVGWTVLGALAGAGLAFFVPNLKPLRGLVGGLVGGIVGAVGFLLIGLVLGDVGGRLFGAAIVGFCIGAMIALAEAVFREAWLEIQYGPRESRTVSLGRQPVTIGSNPEVCTVLARGAPAVALRYTLCDGRITCEDVAASQTFDVVPGDRRTAGNLGVLVCATASAQGDYKQFAAPHAGPAVTQQRPDQGAAAPATQPSGGGGFQLCIRGRRIALGMGARLTNVEIAGLETTAADRAVAEVVPNPTDASITGLKNLSTRAWTATLPSGERKQIEPGRSIRLAAGTKIHFGVLECLVEQVS